jgi:uncharacterized protein
LSDAIGRGITVTEIAAMDQPVDTGHDTAAVFIGRALRGPLHIPVLLGSVADFRRRFGGTWHHSSLGPAVEQFFEHGGRRLHVVRVANNARGAMLCLPAQQGVLVLRAVEPGSTERIRAAVDYDGLDDAEHFNLTLQRIAPDTGLIADQEIHRGLSCRPEARGFIASVLQESSLAEVQMPLPGGRPLPTGGPDNRLGYVEAVQPGSDGSDLCDYDLIGSGAKGTGLFSLEQLDRFDLLYLPPPGREGDLGPAAVLAAELYCRRRGAMLVMDPPSGWADAEAAIAGLRRAGYASPNIAAYFPRVTERCDRAARPRAAGGAVAGLLCRHDRRHGPWQPFSDDGTRFNRRFAPALDVDAEAMARLTREGFNVIAEARAGQAALTGSVTLARNSQLYGRFASLPVRRLCLAITAAIERATRWSVFEAGSPRVAERVHAQVHAYMTWLAESGAFADDRFLIHSDAGRQQRGVTLLLTFQPAGAAEALTLSLHQGAAGCRVTSSAFPPSIAQCA